MHPLFNANEFTRRQFMERAAKMLFGVNLLPVFDQGIAGAAVDAASRISPNGKRAKNVIYLYMAGGMSQIDTFDPKPGSENQGPVSSIGTEIDGLFVSQYLPLMAMQMQDVAVIRSLTSTQGAHQQGRYFMHTSYAPRGSITHPGLGAWILALQGRENVNLPGAVRVGGRDGGPGFLGTEFAPVPIGDPNNGLQNIKPYGRLSIDDIEDRIHLSELLDTEFHKDYPIEKVKSYNTVYREAMSLMNSQDLGAFDISSEPESLKKKYGSSRFARGCLLSRRLVENGVRFAEVILGGWDTHNNNFANVQTKAMELDQAMSALIEDLRERRLLDDTLVVLATEFGRTPKINVNDGRDHFPSAFTCLLAGSGIKGGTVYGSTNTDGTEVESNPITIPDFNATIAHALGLPIAREILAPNGRPFTIADDGKPITELFV
ncbi:MAG: DUF1501 domain-containing protein [Verrucomicrobiota bacterium]